MSLNIPPKPEESLWTDDQWKAIQAKGNNVLVAAAAGSGKTAVLCLFFGMAYLMIAELR